MADRFPISSEIELLVNKLSQSLGAIYLYDFCKIAPRQDEPVDVESGTLDFSESGLECLALEAIVYPCQGIPQQRAECD